MGQLETLSSRYSIENADKLQAMREGFDGSTSGQYKGMESPDRFLVEGWSHRLPERGDL